MNERDIANGFSALWSEFFPMLSPTFIIAFNDAFVRPILGRGGIVEPVPLRVGSERHDVLAEFAFRLAAVASQSGLSAKAAAADESTLSAAASAATHRIHEFGPDLPIGNLDLEEFEKQEGIRLAAVYEEFLTLWPAEPITFSPMIKGSGFLNSCSRRTWLWEEPSLR